MTLTAYREIFRQGGFWRFWGGFTLSVLGDALTRVAFTWFVYDLTDSAEALGWLMLCFTGPIVVGGLLAGWLLDRFDRRMVMIVDNLVRGTAIALVPLLYALGRLELWHIYAVAALYGLLMMIALAGGPALIPSLVRPEQLATANALEMISFTIGGVIGPVVAGLLLAVVAAPYVVLLDALSYFAYALLLAGVRLREDEPTAGAQPRYGMGHATKLLVANPVLLSTTLMFLCYSIGGGMLAVWLPILADRVLGGGSTLYGALLGVIAGGEVVGALLAGSLPTRFSLGARICIAQALAGVALLLLLAGGLPPVVVGLALFGTLSAPLTIWAQTLRMQVIPPPLRGRVFALIRTTIQSGNPLGGAAAGSALALLGLPALVALSALLVGGPGVVGASVAALRRAGTIGQN